MIAAALIQNMTTDGLRLSITPTGKIKAAGEQETINRWLPVLQTRKAEIVSALSRSALGVQEFIADIEERAAIMEFDAPDFHPDRNAATAAAYEECRIIWLGRCGT